MLPHPWRISASAALLGLGQNGLLVALPVLVARFELTLAQWAGLIMAGSMLFVIGSPFWGRMADRHGSRPVVIQALAGYIVSFMLIALILWFSAAHGLPTPALLAGLLAARAIYGLSVSGMVPACQQWAVALDAQAASGRGRVAALATVSAGLSTGRLLGPLVAAASLTLSVYAPFVTMLLAGLLALLLVRGIANPIAGPVDPQPSVRLPAPRNGVFLIQALLLAMSVSLMQLGLPAALQAALPISAERASHLMGLLLSLAAGGALLAQLGVIRSRRLAWPALLGIGGLAMTAGYALLVQAHGLPLFAAGVVVAGIGAALAVPGYTAGAAVHQAQGASAGYLAMAHTLGYAAAMLWVASLSSEYLLPLALGAAAVLLALVPLARYLTIRIEYRIEPARSR